MAGFDVERPDTPESVQMATKLLPGDKMPKMPDLSGLAITAQKVNPFVLDDYRGSNAYKVNQP
jgi:hypothetical protein